MQFNPGNGSGIVDEIDDICGSNSTTYPIATKTRRVNQALDEFVSLAIQFDKAWSFDDTNKTGLLIGMADLTANQQDYSLDEEFLMIRSVFVKDNVGVYHELTEETDPQNTFLLPSGTGVPTKYRFLGGSILLDKIPNYTSTDGLKIHFVRRSYHMSTGDTTISPGIPLQFHDWLAQVASLPFLIKNRLPNKNDIAVLIQAKKDPRNADSIPAFYARRSPRKLSMRIKQENNR